MKPILTPCSFSNFSWKRLRISITGAMFTSLNVVRMALVDCDCSRRSATRARRRLIGTRCSGRSPQVAAPAARRPAAAAASPARRAGAALARRRGGAWRPAPPATAAEHVALGHAAVLAGAGHRAGGQLVVGHQLGGGRHGDVALGRRPRRRDRGRHAGRRAGRRLRRRHALICSAPSRLLAFGVDLRDHLARRRQLSPSALTISASTPAAGRRHFEHDLVGLDLDQDLVDRDGLAGLLLPLQQGRFGHRLGQLRNLDFNDGHFLSCLRVRARVRERRVLHLVSTKPLSLPKACSSSAFCCSWCRCA